MSNRVLKINSLLKEELSKILSQEIDFEEGVLATITRVETSANLFEAKAYVSVIFTRRIPLEAEKAGTERQVDRIFKILNKKVYDIQQVLNKRLKMRPIPRIEFKKEEKTKKAGRVEELLESLKKR